MTKEEAVFYIKELQKTYASMDKKISEAIDVVIDALSRPKGKWLSVEIIDDDLYNGVNEDAAECSVCGYVSESYYWAKTYYKFCPNCGARMKGGAE